MFRAFLLAGVAGSGLVSGAACAQSDDQAETVVVTAKKLDEARNGIQTQIGASTYTIDETAIAIMPGGANNQLNQVLLQAPDVVQDQFGQLHIRAEHNALQYRLNGVILPEGISVFSQTLDPRLASQVQLITGALPAEYGLVTGGIVDIRTKTGLFDSGGEVSMYGGAHGEIQPSVAYGGSSGSWNYFVTGDYLQNNLGIDSPDGSSNPIHDFTSQYHAFGYAENVLDSHSRISIVLAIQHDNFEIPNTIGQPVNFTVAGLNNPLSQNLDDNQREITHYGAVSYLRSQGPLDFQISLFGRYSSLDYMPDPTGADLAFLGISQVAYKRDLGYGTQTDAAYHLNDNHTIRAGILLQQDDLESLTSAQVLPAACSGSGTIANPTNCMQPAPSTILNTTPFSVIDNGQKGSSQFGAYIQDEWKVVDHLTVNYGIRYDRYTSFSEGSQFSPRINAVWEAPQGTTLNLGYSRYFSPPPFELVANETVTNFADTTAAPAVSADTTPVAERANYFDAGAQQKMHALLSDDDAFTFGVDSFLKLSKNLIDEGQFGAPIILTPFNYRHGKQYGVQFSGTYDNGPFSLYANFALQHAKGKDIVSSQFNFGPDELAYIQDHYIHLDHEQAATGSGGISYNWQGTRFSLDTIYGSGLRKLSAEGIPNGAHLPGYAQVNLGVSHTFTLPAVGDLAFRLDLINALDSVYQIRSGTGVGVGAPSYGPRRGFFAGITKEF